MDAIALDDIPLLWRGESLAPHRRTTRASGCAALDEALGGGWPAPSLIEVLCDSHGIGELRLMLGVLKSEGLPAGIAASAILWISPPFELHAIALMQQGFNPHRHWVCAVDTPADLRWAMAQGLRSGACHAVIGWAAHLSMAALRSLKLAAVAGGSVGVLFRPTSAARIASPATVRVQLTPRPHALEVSLLKVQGRRPSVLVLADGHGTDAADPVTR